MEYNPPKVIFFDVGNVLLFFSHQKMFEQIASVCETDIPTIQSFFQESNLQLRYESGKVTTNQVFDGLAKIAGHPLNKEHTHQALSEIFHLNDAILPLIRDLRQLPVRLIILSNISEIHHHYINEQYGLFDPFDKLVLSYQIGAVKPDPKIFRQALQIAECTAEEAFYTDDVPANIDAARKLSIDSETFTGAETLRGQLRARGLAV
jgi:HAD superfamily hydrolase (TIGR01509 family)